MNRFPSPVGAALAFAVGLWFVYLLIKVAQHVGAWPFG